MADNGWRLVSLSIQVIVTRYSQTPVCDARWSIYILRHPLIYLTKPEKSLLILNIFP